MIAGIRLEDFKRFRDLSLNTAALTVLTGANGAGKTSVLQSILLARQMARQPQRSHVELLVRGAVGTARRARRQCR